jgi:hypothetical protein
MADAERVRVFFVDRVSPGCLLRLWSMGDSVQTVWHFDTMAPAMQRVVDLLSRWGLIRATFAQVRHQLGHLRDGAGRNDLVCILEEARAISTAIRKRDIVPDPLMNALASRWPLDRLVFHFDKLVEKELTLECLRINLAEWIARTQLGLDHGQWMLLLARGEWFASVQQYAASRRVRMASYRQFASLSPTAQACLRGLSMLGVSRNTLWSADEPGHPRAGQHGSTVAIRYWYRSLSFDPSQRSEFFWLPDSGIPESDILLYDYVSGSPLDTETRWQIQQRGVTLLGRGPGIPSWRPTWRCYGVLCRLVVTIIWQAVRCLLRLQRTSRYVLEHLIRLAAEYAYWYDFFSAHRVRIHVGIDTSVAQVLALENVGGVSIGYQYSISEVSFCKKFVSAGEHVQFVFSSLFERLWRDLEAPIGRYVQTGFIYDGAFQKIHDRNHAGRIRAQLLEQGAKFIACFFDENSLNRWDFTVSDDMAADDYEYLLTWLLSDPTLGLVVKPKRSATLFHRLSRLAGLIDQARRTGRCLFLTSETIVGNVFPAEAALASDVCIGKLEGATAALEARLAGVPAVLMDTEGFRTHPFHAWGRGRVVFDDWPTLRRALEQFRAAPTAHPEFGDWGPVLDDLDPFRDGQATRRLGAYIGLVYEALKDGASTEVAVASASTRFAQQWGEPRVGRACVLSGGTHSADRFGQGDEIWGAT